MRRRTGRDRYDIHAFMSSLVVGSLEAEMGMSKTAALGGHSSSWDIDEEDDQDAQEMSDAFKGSYLKIMSS